MPPRRSANPVSMLNMQLTQVKFPVSKCRVQVKFGFLDHVFYQALLLNNSEVNSEGMCWGVWAIHRGVSWDPRKQRCKPYLRQDREAKRGRNTSLLASKWNGERRRDATGATKTRTHTHANNYSSILPGSFVQQHCRGLPESPTMNEKQNTRQGDSLVTTCWHECPWLFNCVPCFGFQKCPVLASKWPHAAG